MSGRSRHESGEVYTLEDILEEVVAEGDADYDFQDCIPRCQRSWKVIDAKESVYPLDSRPPCPS